MTVETLERGALNPTWLKEQDRLAVALIRRRNELYHQFSLEELKFQRQLSILELQEKIFTLDYLGIKGLIVGYTNGMPILREWPRDPQLNPRSTSCEKLNALLVESNELNESLDSAGQSRMVIRYSGLSLKRTARVSRGCNLDASRVMLIQLNKIKGREIVQGLEITGETAKRFAFIYPIGKFPTDKQEKRFPATQTHIDFFRELLGDAV